MAQTFVWVDAVHRMQQFNPTRHSQPTRTQKASDQRLISQSKILSSASVELQHLVAMRLRQKSEPATKIREEPKKERFELNYYIAATLVVLVAIGINAIIFYSAFSDENSSDQYDRDADIDNF